MRCQKRGTDKGNSAIEFILVLPWLAGCLLILIRMVMWVTTAQLVHYAAFKKARAISVYEAAGAQKEVEAIIPAHLNPMMPNISIDPALRGVRVNLNNQEEMDNPIGFCGENGDYGLCAH